MSLALTLPSSRSSGLRRPVRHDAALAGIDLPEVLFKIGGFLAGASLLVGMTLYEMGSLTLCWVKLLPISACGGGALLCLGVLILCIRELRVGPEAPNFETRTGNSV